MGSLGWNRVRVASLAALLAGCHGGGETSAASAGSGLQGVYLPSGPSSAAEYRAFVFVDDTRFLAYPAACEDAPCRVAGTYVYDDGAHDLALTNGVTRTTTHVTFEPAAGGDLHGLGLVSGGDGPLVQGTGTALIDGVPMALAANGESDQGESANGPCRRIVPSLDCGLQGLSAVSDGTGSCTCGPSLDNGVNPSPTLAIPVVVQQNATGSWYPTVQLSIGGGAPVTAILDTGSSGVWVVPGVIPAGGATPTGGTSHTGFGGDINMHGNLETATVQLGTYATSSPILIGEITSTCSGGSCSDATNFRLAGRFEAIVGIGLHHWNPDGIWSPLLAMGQNLQHVLSLGAYGDPGGTLTVDPPASVVHHFARNIVQLNDDGTNSNGVDDSQFPFCVNALCGKALLDSGNPSATLQVTSAADYDALGVANMAKVIPANTGLTVTVGTALPWELTVGTPPTRGLDVFLLGAAASNLSIEIFHQFDVFYDDGQGQISPAAKLP